MLTTNLKHNKMKIELKQGLINNNKTNYKERILMNKNFNKNYTEQVALALWNKLVMIDYTTMKLLKT